MAMPRTAAITCDRLPSAFCMVSASKSNSWPNGPSFRWAVAASMKK